MRFSSILLHIFASFLFFTSTSAQQVEVLDNKTVINLSKKKIQESIIISKIQSSTCLFDVTTDGLINLKEQGVSDKVIEVMIGQSKVSSKKTGKSEVDGILAQIEESGIYFLDSANNEIIKLDPTPTTGQRQGSYGQAYASGITGGLSSKKNKLQIAGLNANYKVKGNVQFYILFESSKVSLNQSQSNKDNTNQKTNETSFNPFAVNPQSAEATSPNDFIVIRCKTKGKSREFTASSSSGFSSKGGINGKETADFQYKKLSKNLYKLTFPEGLQAGHYIFYYAGNSTAAQNPMAMMMGNYKNDIKVFDFDVIP